MHVLFINQFYAPDAASTAQILADLCVGLSGRQVEVSVICSRTAYCPSSASAAREAKPEPVRAYRVPGLRFERGSFMWRAASYLSFLLFATLRGLFIPRADVIVTLTTPPFVGLVGVVLAWTRRSRLVLWSMDLYPEVAVAAGAIDRNGWVARVTQRLAHVIYRRCERVVALGPFMRQRILEYGLDADRVQVIHNWSDGDLVQPVAHGDNLFRAEHELNGCFAAMYSGNMGVGHQFDGILDAVGMLARRPNVRFVFIGEGPRKQDISDQMEQEGLDNLSLLPYQPRERLDQSLSAGDVHLVSLRDEMQGLIVPSKIYGILAAGRPAILIGGRDNEVAQIIEEHQCGFVVPEGDSGALCAAIEKLAGEPELAASMGRRARAAFEEHYNFGSALAAWQRLLADIGDGDAQARAGDRRHRSGSGVGEH